MQAAPARLDGSFPPWSEIKHVHRWEALLLGNGLSINLWPGFEYGSLFEQAKAGTPHGKLADKDLDLFRELDTENFERVLFALATAIRVGNALASDVAPLLGARLLLPCAQHISPRGRSRR